MRDVHMTFTVRLPASVAADSTRSKTYLDRVVKGLLAKVDAYFDCDEKGQPKQAADGTYLIHGPDWTATDFLRSSLRYDEGMEIVSEQEAPGRGWRSS